MRALLEERDLPISEIRFFAARAAPAPRCRSAATEIVVEDAEHRRSERARHRDLLGRRHHVEGAGAALRRSRRDRDRQLKRLAHGPRRAAGRQRGQPARDRQARPDGKGIIANPNCTTMAAMPVLKVLRRRSRAAASDREHLPGGVGRGARGRRGAARAGGIRGRAERHRPGARRPRGRPCRRRTSSSRTSRSTCCRSPARSSTTGSTRPTKRRSCATRAARSSSFPSCW